MARLTPEALAMRSRDKPRLTRRRRKFAPTMGVKSAWASAASSEGGTSSVAFSAEAEAGGGSEPGGGGELPDALRRETPVSPCLLELIRKTPLLPARRCTGPCLTSSEASNILDVPLQGESKRIRTFRLSR